MSEAETQDLIRYDILAQEALRGVVKQVLQEVARAGLPGEHHFYISFATDHPGVRLSTRMREQYPNEMTIVIQHQYWDLKANDHGFEIGLSFNDIPENLLVPYSAIKGFFDPSVQFGLQFETPVEEETGKEVVALRENQPLTVVDEKSTGGKVAGAKGAGEKGTEENGDEAGEAGDGGETGDGDAGADVVSLDAFRKK